MKNYTSKVTIASVARVMSIALVISYIATIVVLMALSIVPDKYLVVLSAMTIIAVALCWLQAGAGSRRAVMICLVTFVMTSANVYMFYIGKSTLDFLESTQIANATSKPVDTTKPFVIYISGIDTSGDIQSVSRSDVNILAVIDGANRRILLVNTPRDYYVQLHGTTELRDKLTHAGTHGPVMSMQTLADLYAVPIDHYVRINFSSTIKLIDTVGGVDVQIDEAFTSFPVGTNHLDGKRALEFSRERYAFVDGDRQRGRNQQLVIAALIDKLTATRVMASYGDLLGSLRGSIDTNIGDQTIRGFIKQQLDHPGRWQVRSISVDGTGAMAPTYSMGAQPLYVIEPDLNSLAAARATIQRYLY